MFYTLYSDKMCDNCRNQNADARSINISTVADAAIQILLQAQCLDSKLTALKLIGKTKSRVFSIPRDPKGIRDTLKVSRIKSEAPLQAPHFFYKPH